MANKIISPLKMAMMKISASFPPWDGRPWSTRVMVALLSGENPWQNFRPSDNGPPREMGVNQEADLWWFEVHDIFK